MDYRDVRIPLGRRNVGGKLFLSPSPAERGPAVLFVHGWGGSQRRDISKARLLQTLGCVCLTFNLRGHAGTRKEQARVTRADSLEDVRGAYAFLVARAEGDPDRVAAVGSSYGAYIAVLLSAERAVRWLVLRAPAIYPDEGFDWPKRQLHAQLDLARYRRQLLGPQDNRVLAAAARFTGDVLLVESERDTVIPGEVVASYRQAFTAARSVTHRILPAADHALAHPAWRRAYARLLRDWFRERLGPAPALQPHDPRARELRSASPAAVSALP